jgi:hypothetical protein
MRLLQPQLTATIRDSRNLNNHIGSFSRYSAVEFFRWNSWIMPQSFDD